MKRNGMTMGLGFGVLMAVTPPAHAAGICSPDSVHAGTVCMDRYEESVWRLPNPTTTNAPLVAKIKLGTATLADLTAAGATSLGTLSDDYAPCRDDGQNCADDIFAVSLPAVVPAANITWFQAQEACANSGRRLPTSAEWQLGATGTPDAGGDNGTTNCNSNALSVTLTGARKDCESARGALDMVGNLSEWVADWVPLSTACSSWGGFSDDWMCLFGASASDASPGALLRGGDFRSRAFAGPLAVVGSGGPFSSRNFIGFRCVR